jgi:hypothetical protein
MKEADKRATARIEVLEAYNLELRLALVDVRPAHRKQAGEYCWCDPSQDVGTEGHELKCRQARGCLALEGGPRPLPGAPWC